MNSIWSNFLNKISERLTPINFNAWFEETKLVSLENNTATVLVPIHVHKKHLKECYYDLIMEVFTEVSGSNFNFEFITQDELDSHSKIDSNLGVPSKKDFETNLNSNYIFDNFIVGDSNKFARTTALAVAEKPGSMYNPLFIYSSSGLGKTHLMHSIGNYINSNSNLKVLYITSEQFVSDFIELHRRNRDDNNFEEVENFKSKYREVDVLMIDDIQYLEIASKTQQEFFNTFNELHTKGKQIIISSDRSPEDLKKLEDRLRTRFSWGLMVDIKPPNFELRLQIINKKIEAHALIMDFSEEVKDYIASNCTSDIRRLEGSITRLVAYCTMMNVDKINLDVAKEALKDHFGTCIVSKNKIDQVQQIVSSHYNISVEDIKSKKRKANISIPRQVAMYICRTVYNESLSKIGLLFGGKNHTTVIHSVEKIKKQIEKNPEFSEEVNKLIKSIN